MNPSRTAQDKLSAVADDVLSLYVEHRTAISATARHFGVSSASLVKWLKRRGVPIRGYREAREIRRQAEERDQQETIDRVIEMRQQGATMSSIAAACGIAVGTVWRILDRHIASGRETESTVLPQSLLA